MDEGEAAPAAAGNLQQGQSHGLAPRGVLARRGGRLIQAANDVARALIDRLPALVLLDLLSLVFPQKERQRLRRGQQGQFRTEGTGEVVAKFQGILLAPAVRQTDTICLC